MSERECGTEGGEERGGVVEENRTEENRNSAYKGLKIHSLGNDKARTHISKRRRR